MIYHMFGYISYSHISYGKTKRNIYNSWCYNNMKKIIIESLYFIFILFYFNFISFIMKRHMCYDSMLKVLSKELTLVLSDTRELDRVLSTK